MRSALAATALGITLAVAGLASCATPEPGEPPSPDPSVTPVFASEEEALAAAEGLYGEYLAAENALGQGGWVDVSLVEPYLRGEALTDERDAAGDLASKGYTQVGVIAFDSMSVQQIDDGGPGHFAASLYLCLDVTAADTVDATGVSVVPEARQDRVGFEIDIDDVDELKISRSEPWSGANFCSL
jgi:hypothetical protein